MDFQAARGRTRYLLAGQDWLLMMKAVIDVGQGRLHLPLLGNLSTPILVDHSGHLAICIDELPENGWPAGLTTKVDNYPGAIFVADRHRVRFAESEKKECEQTPSSTSKSTTSTTTKTYFIPNYKYEPNDDTLNTGLLQGLCSVQADYWEYDMKKGCAIRHHCRPRKSLFELQEAHDRPDPEQLLPHRVTVAAGSQPLLDDWQKPQEVKTFDTAWTGWTCFFLKGYNLHHNLPQTPEFGTLVTFEGGDKVRVDPQSLSDMRVDKKIHKFDLTAKTPEFEHAATMSQQPFTIPEGQFGSKVFQQQDGSSLLGSSRAMGVSMDAHGAADELHDEDRIPVPPHTRSLEGTQASLSGPHVLRGGDRGGGVLPPGGAIQAHEDGHDSSSGNEPELQQELPPADGSMPTRVRVCQKDGQCPREIHGVHGMRTGEESVGGSLHRADHQRGGRHLRAPTRNSRPSRREDRAHQQKPSGLFNKLGQVLFALIATQFGATLQGFGGTIENYTFEDLGQDEFSFTYPRISGGWETVGMSEEDEDF